MARGDAGREQIALAAGARRPLAGERVERDRRQQLFLCRYSSDLVSPADTNTGLKFVTRHNVGRYLTTRSRYEGSSNVQKYPVSPVR